MNRYFLKFKDKADTKFKNNFIYDEETYMNNYSKIKIYCKRHNIEFLQTPRSHLQCKYPCPKCYSTVMNSRFSMTVNDFIRESIIIFNDKYDYRLVEYINNKTKVKIICKIHGIFEKIPHNHIHKKQGCPKCSGYNLNIEEINAKCNRLHDNKYEYDFKNYKSINSNSKIEITCPQHGLFKQTLNNHMNNKQGCPKCSHNYKLTIDDIKYKIEKIHNNKYKYDFKNYRTVKSKIDIKCSQHGLFKQSIDKHLNLKQGCPYCKSSKGEDRIRKHLKEENIKYEEQFSFKDLSYKSKLKYDFYLPNYNTCIEYDGIQHYKIIEHFGGRSEFMKLRHRDYLKNKYCHKNNIRLIRIPYYHYDIISNIIDELIN